MFLLHSHVFTRVYHQAWQHILYWLLTVHINILTIVLRFCVTLYIELSYATVGSNTAMYHCTANRTKLCTNNNWYCDASMRIHLWCLKLFSLGGSKVKGDFHPHTCVFPWWCKHVCMHAPCTQVEFSAAATVVSDIQDVWHNILWCVMKDVYLSWSDRQDAGRH